MVALLARAAADDMVLRYYLLRRAVCNVKGCLLVIALKKVL